GNRGQEATAGVGQAHPPLLAHEQRATNAVFELADLIADRGLRQPELVCSAREIFVSAGGLEGANRGKGRKAVHLKDYKLNLYISASVLLAQAAAKAHLHGSEAKGTCDARRTLHARLGRIARPRLGNFSRESH